jgi:hypothetical protein
VTRNDADLAAIVGHELAHVNMGHYQKQSINGFIGQAGGLVIDGGFLMGGIWTGGAFSNYLHQTGMMAFSVGFEMEADYVGAYYAAREDTILPEPRRSGVRWRWKTLPASAWDATTRLHPSATCKWKKWSRRSPTRSAAICRCCLS